MCVNFHVRLEHFWKEEEEGKHLLDYQNPRPHLNLGFKVL